VGNEAKDDPSKIPRLLMEPKEVTKLNKPASCVMMMRMMTMMLIIRILYPGGDGIVQIP
jgi:hypothetical protein